MCYVLQGQKRLGVSSMCRSVCSTVTLSLARLFILSPSQVFVGSLHLGGDACAIFCAPDSRSPPLRVASVWLAGPPRAAGAGGLKITKINTIAWHSPPEVRAYQDEGVQTSQTVWFLPEVWRNQPCMFWQ